MGENLSEITDVAAVLRLWEENHQPPTFEPIPYLERLCELVEQETENYFKMDPDPFDDRNPSRNPDSNLGHMLKVIFKKDTFMNKLVGDYLRDTYWSRLGITSRDSRELNTAAARLVLDLMPGLETSIVFQDTDGLILRLFNWAEHAKEPLQSYATGLLAAAMELQDLAANFREQNAHLVPIMLKRLKDIQNQVRAEKQKEWAESRPFAKLLKDQQEAAESGRSKGESGAKPEVQAASTPEAGEKSKGKSLKRRSSAMKGKIVPPPKLLPNDSTLSNGSVLNDSSNSSWAEMESYVIGTFQMHPVTNSTRQILILRYLTPMGEYQELLGHVFENNAMELIFNYINLREMKDSRLAFEALKYLGALLCHKKFAIEFVNAQGLQRLLEVPRPSVAATGVSMCLYYVAYCEDAMEKVCLLPHHLLQELVRYGLWLLECSHESGRCHATMFFGCSFQFRIITELFDNQDGLRLLYNMISTLPILSIEDQDMIMDDDQLFASRQTVRHVCSALKRYFEGHLSWKAEQMQHSQSLKEGGSPQPLTPPYKATKLDADLLEESINTLQTLLPFRAHWSPVDKFVNLGGVSLLLQGIALAYDWSFTGKADTVRTALDALAVCAVIPKVQLLFCEKVPLPDDSSTVGMNILLGAAEGDIVSDAEVQRSALNVLIRCLCAPLHRPGASVQRNSSVRKRNVTGKTSEEVLNQVWDCVRSNNGIMVLMELMTVKTPITDADSIRSLACHALVGLARSESARQIMGKLPLFTSGQLQVLTREPILQDKRQEHVKFQKYALQLLERVAGKVKPGMNEFEVSLAKIHKADIVAQTRIQYNEKQLLQLIHQHLLSVNLSETAALLQREANLPPLPIKQGFPPYRPPGTPGTPRQARLQLTPTTSAGTPPPAPPSGPMRFNLSSKRSERNRPLAATTASPSTSHTPQRNLQKINSWEASKSDSSSHAVSLDAIVTEYLMNQHALCKNPMVTCPQFDLLHPHKCPDPKSKNTAPLNFTVRLMRKSVFPPYGGPEGAKLDRKLIYSRFRPVRTFRSAEQDMSFTCCAFSPCEQFLMVGTGSGELKLFNMHTAAEEATYQCHDAYLFNIEPNWEGNLLLTSSTWRRPLSALWSVGDFFDMKYSFDDEEYVEFSKSVQDKILGTKGEIASIYDVTTGKKIISLKPTASNSYTKNRATFHPSDDLILSDGVLWDATSGKEIHKFDKLNQYLSGTFHPNGLEVISSSEVWDIRTFHLLRTVPALDQCQIDFNHAGTVIYAIHLEQENEDERLYDSSFKTLNASDYSQISTIDVKKSIYGLCSNKYDTQIAIVENQGSDFDSVQESIVRLYDVGRLRDDEDVGAAEEEEEEPVNNSEDDDDDDDDDIDLSRFSDDDNGAGDSGDSDSNSDFDDEQDSMDSDQIPWATDSSSDSDDMDEHLFALNDDDDNDGNDDDD